MATKGSWLSSWGRRRADGSSDTVRDFFARQQTVGLILPGGQTHDEGATLRAVTGGEGRLTIELDTGRSLIVTGDATVQDLGTSLRIQGFDVATLGRDAGDVRTYRTGTIEIVSAGPARMQRTLTVADVREAIAASSDPARRVWIGEENGELPGDDDVAVLVRRLDGTWLTSSFERGSHQQPIVSETEDEACRAFLEMIGQLSAAVVRAFFRRWRSVYFLMPDGWLGRPHDGWYQLEAVTDDGVDLTITFDGGVTLVVPCTATVRDVGENLLITDFESASLSGGGFGTRRYRPGVIELMVASLDARPIGQHGPR